jgi:hypothetical protein
MSSENEKSAHADVDVAVVEARASQSDDAYLELLGYKNEFRRDFSFLGLFSLVSSELAVLPGVTGTIWCVGHAGGRRRVTAEAGTRWGILA